MELLVSAGPGGWFRLPARFLAGTGYGGADGFRFCENKEPYVSSAFHGSADLSTVRTEQTGYTFDRS